MSIFTTQMAERLAELVEADYRTFFPGNNEARVVERSRNAWAELAERMCAEHAGLKVTGEQCKTKFNNMKKTVKKQQGEVKREKRVTGGGPRPPSPPKVPGFDAISRTFADDAAFRGVPRGATTSVKGGTGAIFAESPTTPSTPVAYEKGGSGKVEPGKAAAALKEKAEDASAPCSTADLGIQHVETPARKVSTQDIGAEGAEMKYFGEDEAMKFLRGADGRKRPSRPQSMVETVEDLHRKLIEKELQNQQRLTPILDKFSNVLDKMDAFYSSSFLPQQMAQMGGAGHQQQMAMEHSGEGQESGGDEQFFVAGEGGKLQKL